MPVIADLTSERLLLFGAAGLVVLVGIGLIVWRLRRKPSGTAAALRSVCIDRLENIVLPDGMGGQIHIEHLILTHKGLVVIDVKGYSGTIFGSDRMDDWTVIGPGGRLVFPNPQATLLDRVAAVREVTRSMPVDGFILFGDDADFSKGQPNHVLRSSELVVKYAKPSVRECEQLAQSYAPHWQRVKAAAAAAGQ